MAWLKEIPIITGEFFYEVIYSIIIVFILFLLKWVFNVIINKKVENVKSRYRWRKVTTYLSFFIGIIAILPMWIKGFQFFFTYLGLSTAGLAIALRDLLASIIGWFFIIWKRPFSIGDRVEIDSVTGDVIDIRLFQFSLIEVGKWVEADQSTGRVVHIPNNKILTKEISNYTQGFSFIWNEIKVLITYESDRDQAKKILKEIVEEHAGDYEKTARKKVKEASKKYMVYYKNLSPIIYTSVKESGVMLTIRYICEPRLRRTSESQIWESILETFDSYNNINFAYPTRRFYFRNKEMNGGDRNEF